MEFLKFLIPVKLISITFIIINADILPRHNVFPFTLAHAFFAFAFIPLTYFISRIFGKIESARNYSTLTLMIVFVIAPLFIVAACGVASEWKHDFNNSISFFYLFNPFFTFALQILQATHNKHQVLLFGHHKTTLEVFVFVILIQFCLYMLLLILLDKYIQDRVLKLDGNEMGCMQPPPQISDSVEREQEEVTQAQDGEYPIKALEVGKTYPGQKSAAVFNTTFGVPKNETVGLLGGDGAGKSTLIKMMSA